VKKYEKSGRNPSRIVKRYRQYGRKASRIVKWYGNGGDGGGGGGGDDGGGGRHSIEIHPKHDTNKTHENITH